MSFISTLKLVLQLLPIVLEVVQIAEKAIPESGKGAAKFAFVKELLSSTVDVGTEVSEKDYMSAVEKSINLAVKLFNTTNVFKKGT